MRLIDFSFSRALISAYKISTLWPMASMFVALKLKIARVFVCACEGRGAQGKKKQPWQKGSNS
jgi:hypothetical protein